MLQVPASVAGGVRVIIQLGQELNVILEVLEL